MANVIKAGEDKQSDNTSDIKATGAAIPLPKAEMQALRDKLPARAITVIEERTGLKRDFIYRVFKATVNLTESAKKVIDTAQDIIKETEAATEALAKQITNNLEA